MINFVTLKSESMSANKMQTSFKTPPCMHLPCRRHKYMVSKWIKKMRSASYRFYFYFSYES